MDIKTSAVAMALPFLWTGSVWAQAMPSLLAPADPGIAGQGLSYVPVTAGLKRFGIVEPKDWRELNRAVGPHAARSGKQDAGARR